MKPLQIAGLGSLGLVILLALTAFGLWGCPTYNVWQKGKKGEAALMQAEQEKQILIEQARAEVEAASLRAEAIQIVGKAAKEFPEYRLQEFMAAFAEALQSDNIQKIIFVPTEAQIPVMEAGRSVR